MDTTEMNRRAAKTLEEWDPFGLGEGQYDAEIAGVLTELQKVDHPTDLARAIQKTYESSFELWIPIEKCVDVSYKLLAIKFEINCVI